MRKSTKNVSDQVGDPATPLQLLEEWVEFCKKERDKQNGAFCAVYPIDSRPLLVFYHHARLAAILPFMEASGRYALLVFLFLPMPNSQRDFQPDIEKGSNAQQLLESELEPIIRTMGFELVQLEWIPRGRVLRIFIEHLDHEISLDDCSTMGKVLSRTLDAAEANPESGPLGRLLQQAYTLEVSSPGLERPLVTRSHFERFIGRDTRIQLHTPLSAETGQKTFHGTILATMPDPHAPEDPRRGTILLRGLDNPDEVRLDLTDIRRANLKYDISDHHGE